MAARVIGAPAPLSKPVVSGKAAEFAAKLHAPLSPQAKYKKKVEKEKINNQK